MQDYYSGDLSLSLYKKELFHITLLYFAGMYREKN